MVARTTGRAEAVQRIKTALIEKKMTQAELADAADCHEKTIQNLVGGKSVRDQTLFDVCMVLGLDFETIRGSWREDNGVEPAVEAAGREEPGEHSGGGDVAPVYMGAYTRRAVDHLVGGYLTIRPAFAAPGVIVAYQTDITWDPSWPSLLFQERNRPDAPYSHRGRLHVPASSMFVHLVSLTKGAMRMVTVSQLDQLGQMRGIIATLNKHRATTVPVAAPIVYQRHETIEPDAFGEIAHGHRCYEDYRRLLADTLADGYVRIVGV